MNKQVKMVLALLLIMIPAQFLIAQAAPWYLGKPISEVKFTGLRQVSERELKAVAAPFIGKPLTATVLSDLERRLYSLEYFDTISASPQEGVDGQTSVVLVYQVVERPVIGSIQFEGNSMVRDSHLLEVLTIRSGETVSRVAAREAEAAILAHYIEKGFSDAKVSYEIKENPARPAIRDLIFTIDEGYRTTIKSIQFRGNTIASAGTLKGLLASKEQSLLDPGTFTTANRELDRENILKWYRENGYVNIKVVDILEEVVVIERTKQRNLTITFVLDEGKQYFFGGFSITGNTKFTTEELLGGTKSKVGAVVNLSRIQSDYQGISSKYYDSGYAFNVWNLEEERNEETATISWKISVQEKGIAYIGAIQVRGNVKTKLEIIERELPFKVGDVFSSAKLRESYFALMNTRYFSAVLPEPSVMANGMILITITVEEQNTVDVRVGGSLSGDEEFPIAFIGKFSDVNFLGEGRSFGVDLSLSAQEQSLTGQFYDAWFLGEELGGGINANISRSIKTTVDLLADTDSPGSPGNGFDTTYLEYENWNAGLGVSLSKSWRFSLGRLNVNGGLGTEINYLSYNESIGIPRDQKIVDNLNKPVVINSMTLGASFDNRDIFYDPSSGFYAQSKASLYGGFLFGARDYIQTDSTLQAWLPLWNLPISDEFSIKTSLGFNSSLSVMWPQFWTSSGDTFSAGERSLFIQPMAVARGWYNWSEVLTETQTGGKALWNNWVELRTPIVPQVLSFDAFFDAVRLRAEKEDIFAMDSEGWLFGIGAGLRLAMQGLPLRLYLGKRFSLDDDGTILWQRGSLFAGEANSTDGLDLILAISLF